MSAIIEMHKVTKAYRGVPAIRDIDFCWSARKSTRWWARTAPASRPSPR